MAPFWMENQMVWTKTKKELIGELMIWRTKIQGKVQGRVQLKESIYFKWLQIGS